MNSCKEFPLIDLSSVTAIPLSAYTDASTMLSPVIDSDGFAPTLDGSTIVIGRTKAMSGGEPVGQLIPIFRSTSKVNDDEEDTVAGRRHSVTVSCEVDDRDSDVWTPLLSLERTCRHLILTAVTGARYFVRSSEDSYRCYVTRDGYRTTLKFHIECLMGLQEIC